MTRQLSLAPSRVTQTASSALGSTAVLKRFELRESLHELFELTAEYWVTEAIDDVAILVGQTVELDFDDGSRRTCMVRALRQLSREDAGITRYELDIAPTAWLATRRVDHRIFQRKTEAEIVAAVIGGHLDGALPNKRGYGGRIPLPTTRLTRTFAPHEYTVQYGETDWGFIQRVLANAGITAMFAQSGDLVLVDDTTLGTPSMTVPFVPPAGEGVTRTTPHVHAMEFHDAVETAAVTLRDYNFLHPELVLEGDAQSKDRLFALEDALETYQFEVGAFTQDGRGDALALQQLEALRVRRRRIICHTNFHLPPGSRFNVVDAPREDGANDLLVTATRYSFDATEDESARATCTLECIPAAVPFGPAPRPKPRIHGTHVGFVVGAEGQEIDIDEHGRVEVEFRWDRRDRHLAGICRRVRVAQAWANSGFGFLLHPRVGEEVVVAYIDGDPDEPLVVGRLYNGFSRPSVSLPRDKTQSVWRSRSSPGGDGFNQILMEDRAGEERLEIHAQRDFVSNTNRHASTCVGVDDHVEVGGDRSVLVGGDQSSVIDGTDATSAKYIFLSTTEDIDLSASGDRRDTSRNHFINSGSTYLESKDVVQVVAPHFHVFAGSKIHLQVGGSSIVITGGSIKITSGGPVEVNGSIITLN